MGAPRYLFPCEGKLNTKENRKGWGSDFVLAHVAPILLGVTQDTTNGLTMDLVNTVAAPIAVVPWSQEQMWSLLVTEGPFIPGLG